MAWFQLDPTSLAARFCERSPAAPVPSLAASLVRGTIGFTLLSVAGFAPWAFAGRALTRSLGEAGFYGVCAIVFIGLSGPLLHRLILGAGSLSRFYKLFAITFTAYAVAWIVGWMAFRGHPGSLAGLLAGSAIMGALLAFAFDARRAMLRIIAVLFLANVAGYFIGGWVEGALFAVRDGELPIPRRTLRTVAMLLWGVFYGLGFGAGLGYAFHVCQAEARALVRRRGGG